MRIDLGGSHIVLVWTEDQYRNGIARVVRAITATTVRLVKARTLFPGLRLVILRRTRPYQHTKTAGSIG